MRGKERVDVQGYLNVEFQEQGVSKLLIDVLLLSDEDLAYLSLDHDTPFEFWVAEDMTKCSDNGNTSATLVGYTAFFPILSCEGRGIFMEDLFVTESHRNRGIGQALWASAIQVNTAGENEQVL